jgi:hypothetical protein
MEKRSLPLAQMTGAPAEICVFPLCAGAPVICASGKLRFSIVRWHPCHLRQWKTAFFHCALAPLSSPPAENGVFPLAAGAKTDKMKRILNR